MASSPDERWLCLSYLRRACKERLYFVSWHRLGLSFDGLAASPLKIDIRGAYGSRANLRYLHLSGE